LQTVKKVIGWTLTVLGGIGIAFGVMDLLTGHGLGTNLLLGIVSVFLGTGLRKPRGKTAI